MVTRYLKSFILGFEYTYQMSRTSAQISEKPMATLEAVALRFNQYGRDLFQFSLPAGTVRDLIASKKMDIDRYHPKDNTEGYQRIPTETRYKKYGKFVAKIKGISPTSILVSLRDKGRLKVEDIGDGPAVQLSIDLRGP